MDWFGATDYEVARQLLQRGVAACYLIAFLSAINQFPALLGDHGLLPVSRFVAQVRFRQAPSLFHWRYSDSLLRVLGWAAVTVSASLVLGLPQQGPAWLPMLAFLLLFALYLSIVNVGQTFYAFGWESLLLEAGFIVAFLGSNEVVPPVTIILFLRWLVFRLEFGAGLIKIRGGREWRDLTALYYHHETQPMPNPLSWFVHHLPPWFHRGEVLGNHVVQLVVPFFLFAPQPVASIAAGLVIVTQLWLVFTGNFAWLNWITIVLATAAIDDAAWTSLGSWLPGGPPGTLAAADAGSAAALSTPFWFVVGVLLVTVLLSVLSYHPARNLFSRQQLMNASFNRLHLVNAYGAFGTVTKKRYEVVIEGSHAINPNAPGGTDPEQGRWQAYEFRGKPGNVKRMPRQWAPYHLRLDWLMWFLALGSRDTYWFEALVVRLLQGDEPTTKLLRSNPFPDGPPRWVRARVFAYRFTTPRERRLSRAWWVRSEVGTLVEPVSLSGAAPASPASPPDPVPGASAD